MTTASTLAQIFHFNSPIFKIYLDEFLPELYVIETRSHEVFEARFSVIYQNKYLIQEKLFPEAWWLGIWVVCRGIIFFYTYPQPEKPQPQGIIAFDIQKNEILWENYTISYKDFTEKHLIAYNIEHGKAQYYLLCFETGKVLQTCESVNLLSSKNVTCQKIFPLRYTKDSFFFHFFADFFKKRLNLHNISEIHYAEWQKLIIMTYATDHQAVYTHYILIINQANEIMWHESIIHDLHNSQNTTLDTFCIVGSHLLYVKHKNQLVVLHLESYI